MVPDRSQASVRKVIISADLLSIYNYEFIHLSGVDNVWADLLSRWATSTPTIRRLVHVPSLSSVSEEQFQWPSTSTIVEEQAKHPKSSGLQIVDGLLKTSTAQIWIPKESSDLRLRLLVIAHTSAGHRDQ